MNQKGFAPIGIIIAVFAVITVLGGYFSGIRPFEMPHTKQVGQPPQLIACTQEAKQCPDGSYVGRTGPACEFTPCPVIEPSSNLKPRIVDHFACSDNCPGPSEKYMIKIYEGVTDESTCKSFGGSIYTYYGWGTYTVCKVGSTSKNTDIQILSPVQGDTWLAGHTYEIKWQSPASSAGKTVSITLAPPRPACLDATPRCMIAEMMPYTIADGVAGTGAYEWTIPVDLPSRYFGSQQVTVTIKETGVYGRSGTFTVSH